MNEVISDAIRLCSKIINTNSPNNVYYIVNLTKSKYEFRNLKSNPEIQPYYGYKFTETIKYLIDESIIECHIYGKWLLRTDDFRFGDIEQKTTSYLHDIKYLPTNNAIYYFCKPYLDEFGDEYGHNEGPLDPNQLIAVLNKHKTIAFLQWNTGLRPKIIENQEKFFLKFLNEDVEIESKLYLLLLKKLINNLNSIVDEQELIEYVGKDIDLENTAKNLSRSLKRNLKFEKSLIITNQCGGWGMFINQKAILKSNKYDNVTSYQISDYT